MKNKINYQEYYNKSKDKKHFIFLVLKDYPHIKESSAQRRWYECIKHPKLEIKEFEDRDKILVSGPKLFMIQDMVKYGKKIDRPYLYKYGYNNAEINWLIDNGYITIKHDI